MNKMNKWFRFSIYRDKEKNKLVIHWNWHVPHIPLEDIEYSKSPNMHQLVFCVTDKLYWVFAKTWEGKYKFFFKTTNDHCACGG